MKKIKRSDYDYLDELTPSGWAWELIRRSSVYREAIHDTQKAIRLYNEKYRKRKDIESKRFGAVILGEVVLFLSDLYEKTALYCPIVDKNIKLDTHIIHTDGALSIAIPKPEVRYCDFDTDFRPQFDDILPFKMAMGISLHWPTEKGPKESVLHDLSPYTFSEEYLNDTIYIGVSRKADVQEVMDALRPRLSHYLNNDSRPGIPDTWKFHMIVFDLKEQNKILTYDDIADIVRKAYPSSKDKKGTRLTFSTRKVKSFYSKARDMIESGEVNKLLQRYM